MNKTIQSNPERPADSTIIPDKFTIINQIRTTISDVRDLPMLPEIVIAVMNKIADPKSSINDIITLVEKDVSLAGRILRIANSAYYGVPRKIDNIQMALVIIGMEEVSNLVASSSILRMFPVRPGTEGFDAMKFWHHSAACAELVSGLTNGLHLNKFNGAYVAGLLHDIGKLFLSQYFHHYYMASVNCQREKGLTAVQVEVDLLGVDHGHIGGWLAQRWNLPNEIVNAISQHHIRSESPQPYSLPEMVDWSDRLFYIMENKTPEAVTEYLSKDESFMNWRNKRGMPLPTLVEGLFQRLERSVRLQELLRQ